MIRAIFDRISSKTKTSWQERHITLVIIAAAIAMMAISLAIGLKQSVWFDEAYSILLAKQPAMQLIHLTSLDTHPPLYYLLLKAWGSLFGWSELALRSLSVLAMGGAALIGGLLVKRLFGARAALVTLPFIVLAPLLLRYGFEIRMYALASLIGIGATYVLVLAWEFKDKAKQWKLYVLYALLVALGVYTLYYTILLWVAHFVWLAWTAKREKRQVVKSPWFVALIGSVLLFLPWLPVFVSQVNNGALAAISQAMTMENLTGIFSFAFVYQPTWQLTGLVSLVVLFVIVTLSVFTVKAVRMASKKERSYLVLFALYMVVPIALVAIVSLVRPMYVERYLAHVLLGGMLFSGVVVAIVTRKGRFDARLAAVGLVAVLFIGASQLAQVGNYNFQRLQKPAVNQAAAAIGNCDSNTTVMANDPYVAIELSYYMPSCEIRFYSATNVLKGGYAPLSESPLRVEKPESELANSHRLVYVYYDHPALTMPSNLSQDSLASFGALNVLTLSAE